MSGPPRRFYHGRGMTECDFYNVFLIALLHCPACSESEQSGKGYPQGVMDAAVRMTLYSELCRPDLSWENWDVPRTVGWMRDSGYLRRWLMPDASEADRFPPLHVVELMLEHNRKFARTLNDWQYMTPRQRNLIGDIRQENEALHQAWGIIWSIKGYEGMSRRDYLDNLRREFPHWYYYPGGMPALPYWRCRND